MQTQLNSEKRTLNELKQVYTQALKDCEKKIAELSSRRDMENLQSIIYQKQYQQALKGQLEGVLEQLHSNEFATVSDYLARCYEDGYIGVMYDLQGQGIPIVMPIDQEQVVQAIQTDSKLSKPLYDRLGEDINKLKTSIRAEVSRGIANGSTWNDIAAKLTRSFKNTPFNKAYNRAMTIARTEGHRIAVQSADHAQHKAKEKGADIVKQWDSTLDGKTRDSHRKVDGEIRELDEKFSNNLMFPGDTSGGAEEVVNCRCALLQRAKWALDDDELNTLKERASYFGLDKTKDFEDFKGKYLNVSEKPTIKLKEYEDEFMKLTDGYSYDDFIKDFGSIKDGFEGSSDEEIQKAKSIAEKILSLRSELKVGEQSLKNAVRSKEESLEILKTLGIDVKNNSSKNVSAELLGKYTDFITGFENTHSGYFGNNKVNLQSITFVDSIKGHGIAAKGIYRQGTNAIEIKASGIAKGQSASSSKSDDFEMHGIAHEYGHYIADSLEKNLGITDVDIVQNSINKYFDGDIFKSPKDLKDCLSSYGSTSYQEAFAEAFAEAYTCKEPRNFSKIFKEELEKELNKRKGNK